jgi:hypothetical protein
MRRSRVNRRVLLRVDDVDRRVEVQLLLFAQVGPSAGRPGSFPRRPARPAHRVQMRRVDASGRRDGPEQLLPVAQHINLRHCVRAVRE